jgi:2-phospho-L-lactate guanylyltransferase (CobY/MobA/RfbA family)
VTLYISDNEAAVRFGEQSSAEELELARDAIRVVVVVAELSSELDE